VSACVEAAASTLGLSLAKEKPKWKNLAAFTAKKDLFIRRPEILLGVFSGLVVWAILYLIEKTFSQVTK
jgi:hypothetical protein